MTINSNRQEDLRARVAYATQAAEEAAETFRRDAAERAARALDEAGAAIEAANEAARRALDLLENAGYETEAAWVARLYVNKLPHPEDATMVADDIRQAIREHGDQEAA